MNQTFKYSKEATKELYTPRFTKRLTYSIICIILPFLFVLVIGLVERMTLIHSNTLDNIVPFIGIVSFVSILFFIYNFIWYYSKNHIFANNYIEIKENEIEYYYERASRLGVSKYLCKISDITDIQQNNDKTIIYGKIVKFYLGAKNGFNETKNSIEIPNVFYDMDKFTVFLKSKMR